MVHQEYEVLSVEDTREWQSDYGPMLDWTLRCRNVATGREAICSINTKEGGKEYGPGDTFFAENKGEKNGIVRLKRVNPDFENRGGGSSGARGGSRGSGAGRGSSSGGSGAQRGSGARGGASSSGPRPFAEACELLRECIKAAAAIGGTAEHGTSLWIAVNRGEIQAPPIPRSNPRTSDPDDRPPPPADEDDPGEGDDEIPF